MPRLLQLDHVRVSIVLDPMHGPFDHACDRVGYIRNDVDGKVVTSIDFHHEPADMAVLKGSLPAQRLIQDHTEPIDIDALIDICLSGQHLGCHVGWSATDLTGRGQSIETEDLGRPEVHQARASFRRPNDVCGLQISVKNPVRMGGAQAVTNGVDQSVRRRDTQGASRQSLGECLAFDVFGDQED
jgi:hypothetical protein